MAWQLVSVTLYFCSTFQRVLDLSDSAATVHKACWTKFEKGINFFRLLPWRHVITLWTWAKLQCAWEAATIEFDMKHIVQHFCMQSRTSTVNPTNSNCNWVSVVWILLNKEHSPKTAVPVLHVHTLSLTHIHVLHCQDLTITANYRETLVLQERRAKTSGDKRERNWEEKEKKKKTRGSHTGLLQNGLCEFISCNLMFGPASCMFCLLSWPSCQCLSAFTCKNKWRTLNCNFKWFPFQNNSYKIYCRDKGKQRNPSILLPYQGLRGLERQRT